MAAAEAVCDASLDVFEGLSTLVDASLVVEAHGQDGSVRFSMLETIREFGLEQLDRQGELTEARRRHASYYLHLADVLGPEGVITDALLDEIETVQDQFEPDVDNLRAALDWVLEQPTPEPELLDGLLRSCWSLVNFWRRQGRLSEGRRRVDAALKRSAGAAESARALALNTSGALATEQGDFASARALIEEGLAIAGDLDDPVLLAFSLWCLGRVLLWQGDFQQADEAFAECANLARRLGLAGWLNASLGNQGDAAIGLGDYLRAIDLLEAAAAAARDLDPPEDAYTLNGLGHAWLRQGDHEQARHYLTESMHLLRPLGESRPLAECLELFAELAIAGNQAARAARLLGFADQLRTELGTPTMFGWKSSIERPLSSRGTRLSEEDWDAAWAAGRVMSVDEAIDEALLPMATPEAGTVSPPAAGMLSRREIEVVRLLADGRTNQEIAATLFISPHTVANHVANTMNKLGLDSRTAVAAWAVRAGIS